MFEEEYEVILLDKSTLQKAQPRKTMVMPKSTDIDDLMVKSSPEKKKRVTDTKMDVKQIDSLKDEFQ